MKKVMIKDGDLKLVFDASVVGFSCGKITVITVQGDELNFDLNSIEQFFVML